MASKISGMYETIYGNICQYNEGEDTAYDIDMGEEIPLDMVDFERFIRDIDDIDYYDIESESDYRNDYDNEDIDD
jgi:hypothetical protein